MADLIRSMDWGSSGGPRVLIEAADWSTRQLLTQVVEAAGYRSASCPGPGGSDHRCHLASGEGCEAAETADIVLYALRPGDQRNREALIALRRRLPGTPVVVDVPERARQADPDTYEACVVVAAPHTPEAVVAALRDATAGVR
jgi:hypothetical protein